MTPYSSTPVQSSVYINTALHDPIYMGQHYNAISIEFLKSLVVHVLNRYNNEKNTPRGRLNNKLYSTPTSNLLQEGQTPLILLYLISNVLIIVMCMGT